MCSNFHVRDRDMCLGKACALVGKFSFFSPTSSNPCTFLYHPVANNRLLALFMAYARTMAPEWAPDYFCPSVHGKTAENRTILPWFKGVHVHHLDGDKHQYQNGMRAPVHSVFFCAYFLRGYMLPPLAKKISFMLLFCGAKNPLCIAACS